MTTTKKSDSDSIESDDRSTNPATVTTTTTTTTTNATPTTKTTTMTITIPTNTNNRDNVNKTKHHHNNNNNNIDNINHKSKTINNKNLIKNGNNTPSILFASTDIDPTHPDNDHDCKYRLTTESGNNRLCEYDDYPQLLHYDDCKLKIIEDDKDSLVGMSASEDEDDAEIREVVNGELREIDNTSDLTSSPPPPHLSHSNCSSPVNSAHNSLLSLNSSSSSTSSSSSSLPPSSPSSESDDSVPDCSKCSILNPATNQQSNQPSLQPTPACEPYPIEYAIGCCRLCCPSLVDCQNNDNNDNNCDHQHPLIPHYPPTVSSIRNAVSHITRLDDFNVVKLSHGFFSQVFKVVHFGTKRVLVLKMNKDFSNRGNALKEIELLNKLNHENIVAFMGTVVHEGALHPLLEYINGGTLEQLIKQFYNSEENLASQSFYCTPKLNVLSPKVHRIENSDWTFVKLMHDVSKGMDYLHKKGYIHRDLASKNIFIRKLPVDCLHNHSNNCDCCESCLAEEFDDRRLVAVIGDFGFATHEPEPDQVLSTVGSPYWLAPECLKNSWYNHKCDVYSFGIVCCELNWRIPADPDYLPRSNDFAVDFSKLNQKRDNLLGRVAQLACRANPIERPEFEAIRTMLEMSQTPNNNNNRIDSNEASPMPDRNNNRLYDYLNKQQLDTGHNHHAHDDDDDDDDEHTTQTVLGANGSVLGATTDNDTSIILTFSPEMRAPNNSNNNNNKQQCLSQPSTLVALPADRQYSAGQTCHTAAQRFAINNNNSKFNTAVENDIFDQHLLRRHLSSFSPAPFACSCSPFTTSSPSTGGLISPSTSPSSSSSSSSPSVAQLSGDHISSGKRFSDYHYSHHHHHHPYLHYHQQQIQQQEKQ